jgi:hypothetical protein
VVGGTQSLIASAIWGVVKLSLQVSAWKSGFCILDLIDNRRCS